MGMTKKQNISFIILSLLVLTATMISFTYAFFSANITGTGVLNASASINQTMLPIFTATPSGDIVLNITDADMLPTMANNTTTPLTASETITVTLIGGSASVQSSCTFNFVWTQLPGSNTYAASSGRGSLKENTLKIVYNSTNVLSETNIDSFTSGNAIANSSITSNGSLTTKVYTITQSFYNLNLSQPMYNASYKSRVTIGNVSCT